MQNRAIALPDLLHALAAELRAMGESAERLQATLSPLLAQAPTDAASHRTIQACDRLTQLLFGTADFVSRLGPAAPEGWLLDPQPAAAELGLADLASRLCCGRAAPALQNAGELEMF